MLFRAKHLFAVVSFQLMFSLSLFFYFFCIFLNESSVVCMAHMACILYNRMC